MSETIVVRGLSNQEFLEQYAKPGRIGLAGGGTLVNKAIGRAQRHLDSDKSWSRWAHAFLLEGKRVDGRHWVIESDLEVHRKNIRLGVQENRLEKFYDKVYGRLAVLDFGLDEAQTNSILSCGLDFVSARATYSIRELIGTLVALRHPSLRSRSNLLARPRSFYCSAFVHHLFRTSGLDLAPGLDAKNTTPEDLWRTLAPHTTYLLEREPVRRRPLDILKGLPKPRRKKVPV